MLARHAPPIFLLLGVLLLCNPLYAFPEGTSPERYYAVEPIDLDDDLEVGSAIGNSDAALVCPGPRECALEYRIDEEGPVAVDDGVVHDRQSHRRGYDVAWVPDSYVRPVEERENGSVWLTHEPIDSEEALEIVALDSDRDPISADAMAAVEDGSIWTDHEIPEFTSRETISHDGEYYRVATNRYSRDGISRPWTWPVRAIGFLAGAALLAVGYRESMWPRTG